MMQPPAHRSYSQLSTFSRCQRQYFLSKIAQVPEHPAVYLVAGSAIHSMIEHINRMLVDTLEANAG